MPSAALPEIPPPGISFRSVHPAKERDSNAFLSIALAAATLTGTLATAAGDANTTVTTTAARRPLERASVTVSRELHIVARFTSRYTPGEPRVINIRRAAKLLDGTVIPSGGSFSMNKALGKRTVQRGFVPAPMISGGRLVSSVGGGISQVATALYNAAFFAGLALVEHTPHSFYISRYPMGREATISWGGPELVFTNAWDAPVVVRLTATAASITVTLYSEPAGRTIDAWTGRPYRYVQPTTNVLHNPRLPRGTRRLVQEAGGPGFTIEYGRRVRRGSAVVSNDRFRVSYVPVNRIVEIGTR